MKTREELIAEMAVIGCVRNPQAHTMRECFECGGKYGLSCNTYRHAEKLHNAGYRKQSDTVREILQKLIYNITANNTNDGYLSESIDYSSTIDDIKELAAQYGVEVEE